MIGDIKHFRFWCQKVLPLVYDNSLSYYEVLCKVSAKLNELINNVNDIPEYIDAKIEEAFDEEHITEILSQFITKIQSAISANNEGTNANSSKDYNVGQMLWLNDTLYRVIRPISAGATFIVDTNIEAVDFETLFNDFVDEVKHDITANDDGTSATATQSWTAGQWLWLNDVLYEVVNDITQGNAYVFSGANANVKQITVEEMISNEATTRANADTVLQRAIESEATAREDADTTLQSTIDNETTAREDADSALQTAIEDIKVSFSNVNAMLASEKITNGECYRCDGYYESGDKGFGFWLANNEADSNFSLETDNGLYMTPIPINGIITANQFGAYGDDTHDDTTAIQSGINFCGANGYTFKFVDGTYKTTDCIDISNRGFSIIGTSIVNCTIKLYGTPTVNSVFRFMGSYQWGIEFGNFHIDRDTVSGNAIRFGDGSGNGSIYHSIFRPLAINHCQTAITVISGTVAFWGCIFEELVFQSGITMCAIDMSNSATAGIPNNRFEHITSYVKGLSGYQRSAIFNMKGYNQVFDNIEILEPSSLVFRCQAGDRMTINNMKIEAANYTNGSTWIFYLSAYSHLNIKEMSFSGDFSNLAFIFYGGDNTDTIHVNCEGTLRYTNTGSDNLVGYSNNLLIDFGYITTNDEAPKLPNYNYDNKMCLRSIANKNTLVLSADGDVDSTLYSKVYTATSGITVNILTSNKRNLCVASNMDVMIVNSSSGSITINVGGNTVGTIATGLTKHLVEYSNGYHLI